MTVAVIITAAVVAVSGLVVMFGVKWMQSHSLHVSWSEYIAGLIIALLVVLPSVFAIGKAWSTAEALTYQEFYNGVETSATVQVVDCRPGQSGDSRASGHSNCSHEFDSGLRYSFTEEYYVTEPDGVDEDGNPKTKRVRKERTVWASIYFPYATKEYAYFIADSLGGDYRFPHAYVKDGEGYEGRSIPGDIPRGDPAEWLDAKAHLDEGDPRPVTRMFSYDNYILASQDELLLPFSEDVEQFKEAGILPDHTANILSNPLYGFSGSYADKLSFVGVEVEDEAAWQQSLMGFNAALGTEFQGDLHMVLIDSSLVSSPTSYLNALKAYWLGEDFGRRAIAKNAIIVVAGVRGDSIVWAQASTGMPYGNGPMLQHLSSQLPGTTLDPLQVIGDPRIVVTPGVGEEDDAVELTVSATPGVLEQIVLQDFSFQRACMECVDDNGDQIGYKDLVSMIEPQWWQWMIMIVIVAVLTFGFWFAAANFNMFGWLPGVKSEPRERRDDRFDGRYDAYRYGRRSRNTTRSNYPW